MPEPDLDIRKELNSLIADLTEGHPKARPEDLQPIPDLPHPSEMTDRTAATLNLNSPEFTAFQQALAFLGVERPGTWAIWIKLADFERRLQRIEARLWPRDTKSSSQPLSADSLPSQP